MGEVYRASDSRLGREVVLKVLPAAMAGDSSRLARFQQEARAVAALNHLYIVTPYSVERDGLFALGIVLHCCRAVVTRFTLQMIGAIPSRSCDGA